MRGLIKKAVRFIAHRYGRGVSVYLSVCFPNGDEWAAYLRKHGGIHAMGEHCSIQTNVIISDPAYLRMGNNVRMSGCKLFGHDGSINMINRALGLSLDSVGKIEIGDNVTIGEGSVLYPGVTIGSNVIILGGAHVSCDVPCGMVYGGVPAKAVCTFDEFVERKVVRHNTFPWQDLIASRGTAFDAALEPELVRRRVAHFFPQPAQAFA
jgi:acetyltransferase-like isoleucine patch superfamily enzyme